MGRNLTIIWAANSQYVRWIHENAYELPSELSKIGPQDSEIYRLRLDRIPQMIGNIEGGTVPAAFNR